MQDDIIDSVIMNDVLNHLRSHPNYGTIILDGGGDDGVQFKKEFRKNEQKKRQELYTTRIARYNKRIDEIQKQNDINNSEKAIKSRQKENIAKNVLLDVKARDLGKRLELMKSIKKSEKKSQNLITEMKNKKIREKQNRDTVRYFDKVNSQNRTIEENRFLVEKCLEHTTVGNSDVLSEIHEEDIGDEIIEEIHEEECIIDSDQSVRIILFPILFEFYVFVKKTLPLEIKNALRRTQMYGRAPGVFAKNLRVEKELFELRNREIFSDENRTDLGFAYTVHLSEISDPERNVSEFGR